LTLAAEPGSLRTSAPLDPPPELRVSSIPQDLLYTKDHEYVKKTADASVVLVGITDYAQGELGDIVFLDLPKPGKKVAAHEVFGTIEAVKAVSELYSPLAGEIVEVNPKLDGEPALVNNDPYGDGWMIKMKVAAKDLAGLMDAAAYGKLIGQ
jgi:glycine cleavage system H protein